MVSLTFACFKILEIYFTLRALSVNKIFIDWQGSNNEICFKDLKTSRKFLFLHFTFRICASNVVKTWCLILQAVQVIRTHSWSRYLQFLRNLLMWENKKILIMKKEKQKNIYNNYNSTKLLTWSAWYFLDFSSSVLLKYIYKKLFSKSDYT